jgi:transcriptional activator Myb
MQRWRKTLCPGLVKGYWSHEEDDLLIFLLSKGLRDWGKVARFIPGRTAKSCRERWWNHLDPTVKLQPWSANEEATLLKLHDELGSQWALIAKSLPGRTENMVKAKLRSRFDKKS